MATTHYTELIERAQSNIDDVGGDFLKTSEWLYHANAEIKKLNVKLVRGGFPPSVTSETITANGSAQYNIDQPMAVIAMYEIIGDTYYRVPIKPKWKQHKVVTGTHPVECYAFPNTSIGKLSFSFYPNPTSGTFVALIVPTPDKLVSTTPAVGESQYVTLPFGWEERIVLGMSQRALSKEETISPSLNAEISAVDEMIDFHVHDYLLRQANTADDYNKEGPTEYINYSEWYYV